MRDTDFIVDDIIEVLAESCPQRLLQRINSDEIIDFLREDTITQKHVLDDFKEDIIDSCSPDELLYEVPEREIEEYAKDTLGMVYPE